MAAVATSFVFLRLIETLLDKIECGPLESDETEISLSELLTSRFRLAISFFVFGQKFSMLSDMLEVRGGF